MSQDSLFSQKKYINCGGKLIDLSTPAVMGILNVTPDSFFDGGKYHDLPAVLERVGTMLEAGASIIDIGGYSTRPGASDVSEAEETDRVVPVIRAIASEFPGAVISVDTFRGAVASEAAAAGAAMINDISGGSFDAEMFAVAGRLQLPYVLMHIRGTPSDMHKDPVYQNVGIEVRDYFLERIQQLRASGVQEIILDPGFGFGKNTAHNYALLHALPGFTDEFGLPLLAGVSRKSMVNRVLGTRPENALNGTTAVHMLALMNGASILRVHDVSEAVEAIKIHAAYQSVQ